MLCVFECATILYIDAGLNLASSPATQRKVHGGRECEGIPPPRMISTTSFGQATFFSVPRPTNLANSVQKLASWLANVAFEISWAEAIHWSLQTPSTIRIQIHKPQGQRIAANARSRCALNAPLVSRSSWAHRAMKAIRMSIRVEDSGEEEAFSPESGQGSR